MTSLRIHLFGRLELYHGEHLLPGFATQKARSLFAFLAMNRGHLVPRDVLIGTFWPEQSAAAARKSLRSELWRIRSALESVEAPADSYLRIQHDDIGFDPSVDYWLDVEEFEQATRVLDGAAEEMLDPARAELLDRTVRLYRGDLLDGIYDEWCLFDRERLRLRLLEGLEWLLFYHSGHQEWHHAIARGRELLHHDPLREHIHRELMRCHWAMGNRPGALLQFEECARLLLQELDIEPMEETFALREAIRSSDGAAPPGTQLQREGRPAATVEERVLRLHRETTPEAPSDLPELVEGTLAALYTAADRLEQTRLALRRESEGADAVHEKPRKAL